MKPHPGTVIDLYCGVGGISMGWSRAGFSVIGVDSKPQPNYPFAFEQMDAIFFLKALLTLKERGMLPPWFKVIVASPPCQAHTALLKNSQMKYARDKHVDLIPQTRELLQQIGLPYVIENVASSTVRRDLTLCGEMFGLKVIRHRWFECSFPIRQPEHVPHRGLTQGWRRGVGSQSGYYCGVYGTHGGEGNRLEDWQQAMDIPWAKRKPELAQAIPPAYSEYIAANFLQLQRTKT